MAEEVRTDIYMKTDPEIKGDAIIDSHKDQIRLGGVEFATSRSLGPIDNRKLGGVSFNGLIIRRHPDVASGGLFAQHVKGEAPNAKLDITIEFVESEGQANATIELKEAYIKEFQLCCETENLEETLIIDAKSISLSYDNGSEGSFDFGTRAPV